MELNHRLCETINPHSTHFSMNFTELYIYIYIYSKTLALHALNRSFLDKNHKNPFHRVITDIAKYLRADSRGLDTSLHFVSLSMTGWGALIRLWGIAIHNLLKSRDLDCFVALRVPHNDKNFTSLTSLKGAEMVT